MTLAASALLALALTPSALAQDEAGAEDAATGPVTYTLQPDQSVLAVLVKYDRSALVAGHDHVVQASSFTGTVTWDPADPSACDIEIGFPVDALVVDPPGARNRAGLEGSTPDGDKRKIKDNLSGKHQLEASKYPRITFESTSCQAKGDRFAVTGPLKMHGVGHTVTANMKIEADGETFAATGSFDAVHSDWGFDPFTALLGSLRNDEALSFTVDVKGTAK